MMGTDEHILKFEAPEIIYGWGALQKVGKCAARLGGETVLVVTDPGIAAAGWLDACIALLRQEGLKVIVYDHVVTNPRDFQVDQGVHVYGKKGCHVIVALGGGSPIDVAKGIAILASNHGSIQDYTGCNLVQQPIPPLICVPTTAGTGADVSQFAVILDSQHRIKQCILSRAIMPDISIVDPHLLTTKPRELMAATGMDTLTHAIEAYVSSLSWPLTDPHALHAIELVAGNLRKAADTKEKRCLEMMSVACLEAGLAFSNAILGAVHALAHPLGGLYDLHHGLVNSILLPPVVRKNLAYAPEKYARMTRAFGVETRGMRPAEVAQMLPDILDRLIEDLSLPRRLSQLGIKREDIPRLSAMAEEDLCMQTNPCCFMREDIERIYEEVW